MSDKTFSNFSFASTASGSGIALTSADLTVAPEMTPAGPGLLFSSGAIEVTQASPISSVTDVDVTLDYTVTAGAGFHINGADLVIAGGTTIDGAGSVDETVTPGGALHVMLPATTDMITFAPVASIDVLKDILVEVPAEGTGTANITAISQQYSQIGVPEPATLAIIGVGLLGFSIGRRRRGA